MQIEFTAKHVVKFFLVCVLLLIAAHIGMLFMKHVLGYGRMMGLAAFVDLENEFNLPTFYSSISLLFSGLLLYLISLSERQSGGEFVLHWVGLAAVFAFLSIDEMLRIHDRIAEKMEVFGESGAFFSSWLTGVFYSGWVIPYGIATVVFGIIYLQFLLSLTPRTRALFIIAAVCYVGGALGFEMISSVEYEKVQTHTTLLMEAFSFIEETLEMVGILVFIRALTIELARRQVQVWFSAAEAAAESVPSAEIGHGAITTRDP
ncbi:MAG: hypothetical protein WAW61_18890 [Methylococcaceae bacterium]